MIVISAHKSCNSGYGQASIYTHTKDPAVELLSDEDTGRITLPFGCLDFLCRFFLLEVTVLTTNQHALEMRKMPIKLLRAGINPCTLAH